MFRPDTWHIAVEKNHDEEVELYLDLHGRGIDPVTGKGVPERRCLLEFIGVAIAQTCCFTVDGKFRDFDLGEDIRAFSTNDDTVRMYLTGIQHYEVAESLPEGWEGDPVLSKVICRTMRSRIIGRKEFQLKVAKI